jgi:hypothetical protein
MSRKNTSGFTRQRMQPQMSKALLVIQSESTSPPVRSVWILAIGQLIRKGHEGDQ